MNPAITKPIWKITHRNSFISFILFYVLIFLLPAYCLFLVSPVEIKDMIGAALKQPTNMTSIFLRVIRGRCCQGNSGGVVLTSWTTSSKKNCFSDLIHSQVGGLILFDIEFLSLMWDRFLKVNNCELSPGLQTILCSVVSHLAAAGAILPPQSHEFGQSPITEPLIGTVLRNNGWSKALSLNEYYSLTICFLLTIGLFCFLFSTLHFLTVGFVSVNSLSDLDWSVVH